MEDDKVQTGQPENKGQMQKVQGQVIQPEKIEEKVKNFQKYVNESISNELPSNFELLDSNEYLRKYFNRKLELSSYMNYYFQFRRDGNIDILKNKIKNKYGWDDKTTEFAFIMILTTPTMQTLDNIFGNGVRTMRLGEGRTKVYFIKINGVIVMLFRDRRGLSIELEEGLNDIDFENTMFYLFNYLYDNREERIKEFLIDKTNEGMFSRFKKKEEEEEPPQIDDDMGEKFLNYIKTTEDINITKIDDYRYGFIIKKEYNNEVDPYNEETFDGDLDIFVEYYQYSDGSRTSILKINGDELDIKKDIVRDIFRLLDRKYEENKHRDKRNRIKRYKDMI